MSVVNRVIFVIDVVHVE